jgi:hypothetical protein
MLIVSIKMFPDVHNKTTIIYHDVDVGDASPVKQTAS